LRKKIGECLIQAGLITEADLQTALACWHDRCPVCQRRLPP